MNERRRKNKQTQDFILFHTIKLNTTLDSHEKKMGKTTKKEKDTSSKDLTTTKKTAKKDASGAKPKSKQQLFIEAHKDDKDACGIPTNSPYCKELLKDIAHQAGVQIISKEAYRRMDAEVCAFFDELFDNIVAYQPKNKVKITEDIVEAAGALVGCNVAKAN